MATPRPPQQLDTATKFASPAASIRSLSQLLEDDRRTPLASAFSSRPVSRPTTGQARGAEQQLQGMLAAKESEAALLRQQLQQLTSDFKFNLKLLEERDAELERTDTVMAGLREAAATREAALQDARRSLSDKDAALREKEGRVAALEERQKQLVELCERQVADARCSRDEEVARCQQDVAVLQSEAANAKAEVVAGYERQVSAATAAEREARQRSQQLAEENEHVRSQLQRAEARIAEQELSMQRMVAQFEGALATLQQLEAQYDSLASDAGAADRLRIARIADLERESEGLRVARAGLQQERDASVAGLSAALAEAERAATEAKQQYHRAMMDAAELTEALTGTRQEAQQLRGRAAAAEEQLAAARADAAAAQSSLQREAGTHARTQGLLETARLHQDAARRDAQEQERLAAQLREAAAVLEADRNDHAKAAEAAEAKLQAAEERARLLADQLEQERRLHVQMLDSREAELAGRWERALEAAQAERATLQQALDMANRQLQAAHRDMETLRLQVQHLRLGAGLPGAAGGGGGGGVSGSLPLPRYAGSSRSSDGLGAAAAAGLAGSGSSRLQAMLPLGSNGVGAAAGSVAGELDGSVQEAASPGGSRDAFADLPDHFAGTAGSQQQQPGSNAGSGPAASAYQQQLHRHIDTLAGKLSNFQRAVEEARQVGQQASQQLAESSTMLPAGLQRRQAAVSADQQMQQAVAAERQQFEEERQRLDRQLAEQQLLLVEREAELQRMQHAEAEKQQQQEQQQRRARQQQDQEQQRRRQQLEQEQQWQWQQEQAHQQDLERRRQQQEADDQQWRQQQQRQHAGLPAGSLTAGQRVATGSQAQAAWPSGQQGPPDALGTLRASWHQQRAAARDLPVLRTFPPAAGSLGQQINTLAGSQPAGSYGQQRRSVSEALAASGSPSSGTLGGSPSYLPPAAPAARVGQYASSILHHASQPLADQLSLPRANGLMPAAGGAASRTAPLRAAVAGLGGSTSQLYAPMAPSAAGAAAGGGGGPAAAAVAAGEDPLARARRQVLAAKSYLRQVAEMGGRAAGGTNGGAGSSGGS